ncbi:ABC transporter substrate-binding protein [Acetobacter ascendens]
MPVQEFGMSLTRRTLLSAAAASSVAAFTPFKRAQAATPVRLLLSWFAQAEVGGFYQALAKGFYAQEGLDVHIDMGGPQVNTMQILAAGRADFVTGYDFQTLRGIQGGMPLLTIMSSFQHDLQGLMTHDNITDLAQLRNHPILISSPAHASYWGWLCKKFGYSPAQAKPYTFNLQPFFLDPEMAVQAYASSEPYEAQQRNVPVKFFPFADLGYPPYGTPVLTTHEFADKNDATTQAFVHASLLGWQDYMRDPEPGNALIRKANPRMTEGQIMFGHSAMAKANVVEGGDTKTLGLGCMTEARWQATYQFMVDNDLLDKTVNWQSAFTTKFTDRAKVMPA